eukprot:TRINITY_DN62034_c0_g1_i1.p1 TRINITY_DN62034_c0_g1~~TRINITY_DN62034_c0_g1_i1.p1  ORF type:complete len:560 (-),score=82.92 TRINITY_DN62034_c0_g1_i1:95-1723(-)
MQELGFSTSTTTSTVTAVPIIPEPTTAGTTTATDITTYGSPTTGGGVSTSASGETWNYSPRGPPRNPTTGNLQTDGAYEAESESEKQNYARNAGNTTIGCSGNAILTPSPPTIPNTNPVHNSVQAKNASSTTTTSSTTPPASYSPKPPPGDGIRVPEEKINPPQFQDEKQQPIAKTMDDSVRVEEVPDPGYPFGSGLASESAASFTPYQAPSSSSTSTYKSTVFDKPPTATPQPPNVNKASSSSTTTTTTTNSKTGSYDYSALLAEQQQDLASLNASSSSSLYSAQQPSNSNPTDVKQNMTTLSGDSQAAPTHNTHQQQPSDISGVGVGVKKSTTPPLNSQYLSKKRRSLDGDIQLAFYWEMEKRAATCPYWSLQSVEDDEQEVRRMLRAEQEEIWAEFLGYVNTVRRLQKRVAEFADSLGSSMNLNTSYCNSYQAERMEWQQREEIQKEELLAWMELKRIARVAKEKAHDEGERETRWKQLALEKWTHCEQEARRYWIDEEAEDYECLLDYHNTCLLYYNELKRVTNEYHFSTFYKAKPMA